MLGTPAHACHISIACQPWIIPLGAQVEEAVMVGVGAPGGMDFDALEALQCMLERRKGGETGVKAVQLLEGDDVWAAANAGRWFKRSAELRPIAQ